MTPLSNTADPGEIFGWLHPCQAGAWIGSRGEATGCVCSRTVARRTGVSSGRWSTTRSTPSIRPGRGLRLLTTCAARPPPESCVTLVSSDAHGKACSFRPRLTSMLPRDRGSDHAADYRVPTDPNWNFTGSCAGPLQTTGCTYLSSD